ncbi:unnamed protein product [Rhizophagus irregularis]|nr:unnamed protein product [Rhizophagus irregularis]
MRTLSGTIETNISRQKNTAGFNDTNIMDFTKLSFIFKGSSFINDSFIDDEKYKILAKLAGPLILHDEYLLAERLGYIKIAVALWIRRVQTSLMQEEQNNIFARFSAQQQNNDNLPTGSRNLVPTSNNIPYHRQNYGRNFVQQQYNDKEELDLEKHNGKVSSKIPTNYGKNRNQNTHASDMEDIIAIPALDFNNQSEILIDISTVQNNIDTPSSYVFPSPLLSNVAD